MAARLFRNWRGPEGQFAFCWCALALGLAAYVPPLPSGHAVRHMGDLLVAASMVFQYRGLALYWGRQPRWHAPAVLIGLVLVLDIASHALPNGHGVRVAAVGSAAGVMLLATALLVWRHGRAASPRVAPALALVCAAMGAFLVARVPWVLSEAPVQRVALDEPGRGNLALVIAVLLVGGLMNLAQIRLVLGRVLQRLREQAQTDALTGVSNRRAMQARHAELHQRAQRAGHGYAVLMADIDHFKQVNDRLGHAAGDEVLRRVAVQLREALRVGDAVGRWGGEEFCLLLPRVGLHDAQVLAERIVQLVGATGEPRVTLSIGVAVPGGAGESAEAVLARADAALYEAKARGRNRVQVSAGLALAA
jgi:diguanylate cyclase (GGDEF)-like protein